MQHMGGVQKKAPEVAQEGPTEQVPPKVEAVADDIADAKPTAADDVSPSAEAPAKQDSVEDSSPKAATVKAEEAEGAAGQEDDRTSPEVDKGPSARGKGKARGARGKGRGRGRAAATRKGKKVRQLSPSQAGNAVQIAEVCEYQMLSSNDGGP